MPYSYVASADTVWANHPYAYVLQDRLPMLQLQQPPRPNTRVEQPPEEPPRVAEEETPPTEPGAPQPLRDDAP